MCKVQGSWCSHHFYANWCLWILELLTFWCSVHSSGKGFGRRSIQVRAGHTGLMLLLCGLQGQIPLLGRALVLPFLRASPACCANSQVCSVKHHKSCVSCWPQEFLEADLFCNSVGVYVESVQMSNCLQLYYKLYPLMSGNENRRQACSK